MTTSGYHVNGFRGWYYPNRVFDGQHTHKYRELGAGKLKIVAVHPESFLEDLY